MIIIVTYMLPTSLRLIVKLLQGRIWAESEYLARAMTFRVDSILEMPPAFGLMTSIRCDEAQAQANLIAFASELVERGLLTR
jgi:hypothetical protein